MNLPPVTTCKKCGIAEMTAVCRWCGTWKFVVAAAILFLAGCATIDMHQAPPAGWPKLAVTEHQVSCPSMVMRCYQHLTLPMKVLGGVPVACAEIDLAKKTCDIWRCAITPTAALEHEYDHCDGRDHEGETLLADLLRNYRAAGGM